MTGPRIPIALSGGARDREPFALPRDVAKYVTRVRRIGAGESFVAFDPEARLEAQARVARIDAGEVFVELDALSPATNLPTREVALIQGVGKGDKLDAVVRDASELGATALYPVTTERSVAERATASAAARWRRIAVDASRQCGRGDVLELHAVKPITEVFASPPASVVRVVLHPEAPESFGAVLATGLTGRGSITIAIGPEGGFSEAELELAIRGGFRPARLGRMVLRTETAPTAALGALLALSDVVDP
ncbi:MAG: 16S rRNA (uracil(1498)-N(3))-methyltransferase [Polyangiaceae bacterium]